MYHRLVVPLDGSDVAEHALVEAEKLAALAHAQIHLIRVIDPPGEDTFAVYGMMADPTTVSYLLSDAAVAAKHYLEFVTQRLEEQGHQVSCEIRHGSAAQELIEAAKPGDLYVIASHGRSGIARWFMGSVAEEVVRRSSVPVLLVKAASYANLQPGMSSVGAIAGRLPRGAAVSP